MTSAITAPNAPAPVTPDGEPYHVAFVRPDGGAIFADTLTEIIAALIDSYPLTPGADGEPATDTDLALTMRLDALASAGAFVQGSIVAGERAEGREFDEDELTCLLADKAGASLELTAPWSDEDVPLILVSSLYAPHTAAPAPTGNVLWLDPATERTFLDSYVAVLGGTLLLHD